MTLLQKKARSVFCVLIMIAFFVPAYRGTSGFSFLWMVLSETARNTGVTTTDTLVLIVPLLLVPSSALLLLLFAEWRLPVRRANVALPFIFLAFFTVVLYLSERVGHQRLSLFKMIFSMQPGFYLACISSIGLLFTKNQKRKRRRRRHRKTSDVQTQPVV